MRTSAAAVALSAVVLAAGCSGASPSATAAGPDAGAGQSATDAPPAPGSLTTAPSASETSAVEDATQWAKTYYTADYRRYNRYADGVVVLSTGDWLNVFQAQRDATRKDAVLNRRQSTATLLGAAPVHVSGSGAEVLLAVDQSVTTQPKLKKPATTVRSRLDLRLDLRPVDGGWLVASVQGRPAATDDSCTDAGSSPARAQVVADTCRTAGALLALDPAAEDAGAKAQPLTASAFTPKAGEALRALVPAGARLSGAPRITAVAIERGTEGSAEMLVFADEMLTTPAQPTPMPTTLRLQVSMQKVGDSWLVAGIRAV